MLFRRKAAAPTGPPPPLRWGTVAEPPGRFSSGIAALDSALGGGCRPGTVLAFEADRTIANEDCLVLMLPAIANFLTLSRGALVVPPAGVRPSHVRDSVTRCIPADLFESRVRILDYTAADKSRPWIVPMARYSLLDTIKAVVRAEKDVRGPDGAPFLEFSALDTLENTISPEKAIRMLTHGVGRVKEVGNLAIVWIRGGSAAAAPVAGMADFVLMLSRSSGQLVLRGIRPAMPARSVSWTEASGNLRVELGLENTALP